MKNKVKVYAQAFDPETGLAIADQRSEIVDLETNPFFKGLASLRDVQNVYESFWNDMPTNLKELILVQKLEWVS
jgi:hypothetical protein